MKNWFNKHKKILLISVLIGTYLKFGLLPTATVFYELHHFTGLDFVYILYSIFKAVGYYLSVWPMHTAVCIMTASIIFLIALLIKSRTKITGEKS